MSDLAEHRVRPFVDAHYPGWKAYAEEEEVDILLANDAFKSVIVPQGTHRVRFVFSPNSVYVGFAVSGVTLLGLVLVFLWVAIRRLFGKYTGGAHQPVKRY